MALSKRTRIAFVLVVVSILVTASFAFYLLIPRLQTKFHYEEHITYEAVGYKLFVEYYDHTPTNVSISFYRRLKTYKSL